MPETLEARIAAVRRFNRFYTQRIGVLRRRMYDSPLSLTEVRVLYELAHGAPVLASSLATALDLDPGYLSRIVAGFARAGWVRRGRSPDDARAAPLALTAAGRRAFAPLDRASHDETARLLEPLSRADAIELTSCMARIEALLDGARTAAAAGSPPVTLRAHRPGDLGWVIERHGALYAGELGWDASFEALVARIAARFIERFDSSCERCWIAERDGERLGSVMLVRRSATIAQLRLLLVEPAARGSGLGGRLVDECILFARQAAYRSVMLWTNAGLDAARAIYESRGFVLVREEPHHSFGHDLVGQTFRLRLD